MSTESTEYWDTDNVNYYYIETPIIITVAYITIGCIGLAGNAFVILVIFTHTAMKKQMSNLLIINQSLIDAITSVVLIFYAIFPYKGQSLSGTYDILICRLWYSTFFLWATMNSSVYNLMTIALERYTCIVHPIMYKNKITVQFVMVLCSAAWVLGAVVVFFYTILPAEIDENQYCNYYWSDESTQVGLGMFNFAFNFALPLLIMVFCYVKIMMVLKSRSNKVNTTVSSQVKNDNITRVNSNVFKTVVTVTICFFICWTPSRCLYFMFNLGYDVDLSSWYCHLVIIISYVNSCCNPFVYVAQYEQFKKGMQKLKSSIGSTGISSAPSTNVY